MTGKENFVYVMGLIKSVIFGLTYLVSSQLLEHIHIFDLLAFRFLIAAAVFEILRLTKVIHIDLKGKNIRELLLIGAFQPIGYYTFETMALTRTSTLLSGIVISLVPLVVMFLETVILKERTSPRQKLFLSLSVLGVLFITAMTGGSGGSSSLFGIVLILLAAVCEGFFSIFTRKSIQRFTPMETTYVMMLFGMVAFNGINLARHLALGSLPDYFTPLANLQVLPGLFYLGAVASCGAYLIYTYMLSRIPASSTTVFAGIITIVTILAGVIFRHESFYWYHGVGAFFILCGTWGVNRFRADIPPAASKEQPLSQDIT